MSIPQRETTLRAFLGLVYPDENGVIRPVDQYALLGLHYVQSYLSAVRADVSFTTAVRARGDFEPTVKGEISISPRS